MKKLNKKRFLTTTLILLLIFFAVIFIIKARGIGSTSTVAGDLRSINNNEIVFNSGFLHDYVHIILESRDSKNLEGGLEFDIINPKGEKVTSGQLYDNKVFRERYKSMSGEWKIVFHFKDNNSSSMINYGYAINSKKENNMRLE